MKKEGWIAGAADGLFSSGCAAEMGSFGNFRAERFQALELGNGAAVFAVGLGVIAEEERPGVGLLHHTMEPSPKAWLRS